MSPGAPGRRRATIGALLVVIAFGGAWLYSLLKDGQSVVQTPVSIDIDRLTRVLAGDERFVNVDMQVGPDGTTVLVSGEVRDAAALAALRAKVEAAALSSAVEWHVEVVR